MGISLLPHQNVARTMADGIHAVAAQVDAAAEGFKSRGAGAIGEDGFVHTDALVVRPNDPALKAVNELINSKQMARALGPRGLQDGVVPDGVRDARSALSRARDELGVTKEQIKKSDAYSMPVHEVITELNQLGRALRAAHFDVSKPEVAKEIKREAPVRKGAVALLGTTVLVGGGAAAVAAIPSARQAVTEQYEQVAGQVRDAVSGE